jgi:hypothetical protein
MLEKGLGRKVRRWCCGRVVGLIGEVTGRKSGRRVLLVAIVRALMGECGGWEADD